MAANTGGNTEKILIVDDVEINRLVLEEIIREMGYEAVSVESGEKAWEIMQGSCPQLLLTDISMPGMTGYELCRMVKGNRKTRDIPIVFISAFDDPKDIVEGFVLGGADYITKPFISEVVQARVGVHLRLNQASRALMEMNRRLQVSVNEQLKQMEQEKKDILYALADIAARNSAYEQEHLERLSQNSRTLAQSMQLSPMFEGQVSDAFVDTIGIAAPLCDIGNIGVPMDVLRKAGRTPEEEEIVRGHADIGAKLLSDLHVGNDYNDFISVAIDIAHHHHENWDGSGYPEGRKQGDIPLAAQIVSIMEMYCSLTEKNRHSREEALEIMGKDSGVKFNPAILDICRKISRQLC